VSGTGRHKACSTDNCQRRSVGAELNGTDTSEVGARNGDGRTARARAQCRAQRRDGRRGLGASGGRSRDRAHPGTGEKRESSDNKGGPRPVPIASAPHSCLLAVKGSGKAKLQLHICGLQVLRSRLPVASTQSSSLSTESNKEMSAYLRDHCRYGERQVFLVATGGSWSLIRRECAGLSRIA
jgi:hypothetical protein